MLAAGIEFNIITAKEMLAGGVVLKKKRTPTFQANATSIANMCSKMHGRGKMHVWRSKNAGSFWIFTSLTACFLNSRQLFVRFILVYTETVNTSFSETVTTTTTTTATAAAPTPCKHPVVETKTTSLFLLLYYFILYTTTAEQK